MGINHEVNNIVKFRRFGRVWVCFGFNESDISVDGVLRASEVAGAVGVKWAGVSH